ncbi:MAG: YbjQ family protein [Candidatus Berkelbacteria bacterium]
MDHKNVTTALELPGVKIIENLGLVRGITVRSRSVFGMFGAGLQMLVGGNITLFTELCEKTREEAYEMMVKHAEDLGANAIVSVRYDSNEIAQGVSEVLCFGTAVIVK